MSFDRKALGRMLLLAVLTAAGIATAAEYADTFGKDGKDPLRSGTGECWRTGTWSGKGEVPAGCGEQKVAAKDSDGDGVVDASDKCPGTPPGTPVNADGCPLDSDGDGVIDPRDKCPGTPPGTPVNADGCPLDSDGDGVIDPVDRCPNTPPGVKVNAQGCPLNERITMRAADASVKNALFAFNSAELTPVAKQQLDEVARTLRGDTGVRSVMVTGHTDNVGKPAYNKKLSDRRAASVRDYLAVQGVNRSLMQARGAGMDQPVASNKTEDGRAQNRRVEIDVKR